jgi:hypothetical protein
MTRTVTRNGVRWRVTDVGPGQTEEVRLGGEDAEYRVAGLGSCSIGDRPARSASGAMARPRARSTAIPQSRPLVVELDRFSVEQIERAAGWDALETGGPLLVVEKEDGYQVVDALGPSPGAERYAHRFFHDSERARDLEQRSQELGLPGRLAGDWHTHCGDGAKLVPSRTDLDCWESCRRETGRDWVGVIVTDPPAGQPRWAAWVTSLRNGRPVTEAARLYLPEE